MKAAHSKSPHSCGWTRFGALERPANRKLCALPALPKRKDLAAQKAPGNLRGSQQALGESRMRLLSPLLPQKRRTTPLTSWAQQRRFPRVAAAVGVRTTDLTFAPERRVLASGAYSIHQRQAASMQAGLERRHQWRRPGCSHTLTFPFWRSL